MTINYSSEEESDDDSISIPNKPKDQFNVLVQESYYLFRVYCTSSGPNTNLKVNTLKTFTPRRNGWC